MRSISAGDRIWLLLPKWHFRVAGWNEERRMQNKKLLFLPNFEHPRNWQRDVAVTAGGTPGATLSEAEGVPERGTFECGVWNAERGIGTSNFER